jgi:hypothetical protein
MELFKEILQYMLEKGHVEEVSLFQFIQDAIELLKPFLTVKK